ncbi:anti-sigma factor family protein [Paracoccus aestuariivivens]|uniref:Anti-sigma factor n=1 Tax=Paracoccus aestuariivivens TaxID=1820333 RepID=A0A6L6JIC8_9RHOB|nr:anti-sigma factor [Paracoccus aestuariivivens]MTH79884.1 hypothetical protein [Paracoccus aestuariivivens]
MNDKDRPDDAIQIALRHGSTADQTALATMAARVPTLSRDVAEWDRQDEALLALYAPIADEPIRQRHLNTLRRAEPSDAFTGWTRVAAVLAVLMLGILGGALGQRMLAKDPARQLTAAAFRAHATFTPEIAHPVEVTGTDEPHLSNWLLDQLGRQITPPGLRAFGPELMGGRVLPNAGGPAVLLIYRDAQDERLSLFIAPTSGHDESNFEFVQQDGARSYWWFDDNLGCAMIGTLGRKALHDISRDAYEQIAGG